MRGLINFFIILTISITFWSGQSEAQNPYSNGGFYNNNKVQVPYVSGYYWPVPRYRHGFRSFYGYGGAGSTPTQPQFFRGNLYFEWEDFPKYNPNKRVDIHILVFNSKLDDKDNQAAIGQWTILLDKYDGIDDPKKKEDLKKQMAKDLVDGKLSAMPAITVESIKKRIEEAALDLPHLASWELVDRTTKKVEDFFKKQSFCLGDDEKFKKQMAVALMDAADLIRTDVATRLNLKAGLSGLVVEPPVPPLASDKLKKAYDNATFRHASTVFEITAVRTQYACQFNPSELAELEKERSKEFNELIGRHIEHFDELADIEKERVYPVIEEYHGRPYVPPPISMPRSRDPIRLQLPSGAGRIQPERHSDKK